MPREKLINQWLELMSAFIKETWKYSGYLPPVTLSYRELKEWYKNPINVDKLYRQRLLVEYAYADQHKAWEKIDH